MGYADQVFDLTGKVAVVTGGSRGLGREIATAVARQGADVVIASRKLENCQQTARDIERETGRQALPYGVHVGRWDELAPFVDAVYDRFGKVDVLVNNAGMSPVYDKLTDVPEKLFDSVINLNFKGPFRLAALIGERMYEAGRGSIINVSSSGSIRPKGTIIPYAGAKAALNAMSEGLADEFGPYVRVNTLMPGTFATDVSKAWDLDAVNEDRKKHTALQRVGQPPEIIGAALFLASDASSYTSGTIIRVDGGMF
jgi:NAD(P)-dependent dehydrogenase (short-subunit alcohol dehydrogenase family)